MFTIASLVVAVALAGVAIHNWRAQQPRIAIVMATAAGFLMLSQLMSFHPLVVGLFWVSILVSVVMYFLFKFRVSAYAGIAALAVAALAVVFTGLAGLTNASAHLGSPQETATVTQMSYRHADKPTETVSVVGDESEPGASPEAPVSGAQTSDTEATQPSLNCGMLSSAKHLVTCVEDAPKVKRDAYIAYWDDQKEQLGIDWDGFVTMAKQGVETRVIVVANSNISDQKARELARAAAGSDAATLPIVRIDGAILNTRGGLGSLQLETFGDTRSQVRVLITTSSDSARQLELAKAGRGVLVECSNITTGVVRNPIVVKVTKPVPPKKSTPPKVTTTPKPTPSSTPSVTPTPSTTPTPTETPSPTATPTPTSTPTPSNTPTPTPSVTETPTPTPTSTPTPSTTPTPSPTPTPTCPDGPDEGEPVPPSGVCPKYPTAGPTAPSQHPTVSTPPNPVESTPPVEPTPADPTTTPGAPDPTMTAPGASSTPEPSSSPEEPVETVDPEPSETATGDVEPTDAPSTSSPSPEPTNGNNDAPSGDVEDTPPSASDMAGLAGGVATGASVFLSPLRRRKH